MKIHCRLFALLLLFLSAISVDASEINDFSRRKLKNSDVVGFFNSREGVKDEVNFSHNDITGVEGKVPLKVDQNRTIYVIDLSFNPLADLRWMLFPCLVELNLESTKVKDISFLASFQALVTLNLNNNPQIIGFRCLGWLTALKRISLMGCQIRCLDQCQLPPYVTSIDLSDNPLYEWESDVFGRLTDLNLASTSITDLRAIGRLTSLQSLDLSGLPLQDLSPLWGLESLESLSLARCSLSSVPKEMARLASLTDLNLSRNSLKSADCLEKLTTLTSLDLSCNDFGGRLIRQDNSLAFLEKLTNLTKLSVACNSLRPNKQQSLVVRPIWKLSNLRELDLECNQLPWIFSIQKLTKLTYLNLLQNNMEKKPDFQGNGPEVYLYDGIDKLPEGVVNDLSFKRELNVEITSRYHKQKLVFRKKKIYGVGVHATCSVDKVPFTLFGILSELHFYDVPLTDIKSWLPHLKLLAALSLVNTEVEDARTIEVLKYLKYLDLTGRKVSKLPSLRGFEHLEYLKLSGMGLKRLPEGLSKLTNISKLDLSQNLLASISDLQGLTRLVLLNLANNCLGGGMVRLDNSLTPLSTLTSLKRLSLACNNLRPNGSGQAIVIRPVWKLPGIRALDLSHNQLHYAHSFQKLTRLSYLDISYNNFKELPKIPAKTILNYEGNPIYQPRKYVYSSNDECADVPQEYGYPEASVYSFASASGTEESLQNTDFEEEASNSSVFEDTTDPLNKIVEGEELKEEKIILEGKHTSKKEGSGEGSRDEAVIAIKGRGKSLSDEEGSSEEGCFYYSEGDNLDFASLRLIPEKKENDSK